MRCHITFPRPKDESLATFPKRLLMDEARGWKVGRFRLTESFPPEVWEATIELPDNFAPHDLRATVISSDVLAFNPETHMLTLEPLP
ncbi:hypothetical protein [Anatilimnocola aggregata]|nr:hypothetical protein [Anatilimnocola aggregata]